MDAISWQAAALAGIILALCYTSTLDYADEQREQAEYCDNVRNGYWPDYNGNAREVCNVAL